MTAEWDYKLTLMYHGREVRYKLHAHRGGEVVLVVQGAADNKEWALTVARKRRDQHREEILSLAGDLIEVVDLNG